MRAPESPVRTRWKRLALVEGAVPGMVVLSLLLVIIGLAAWMQTPAPTSSAEGPANLSVTELIDAAHQGAVRAVRVDDAASTITAAGSAPLHEVTIVQVPPSYLHDTIAALIAAHVPVREASVNESPRDALAPTEGGSGEGGPSAGNSSPGGPGSAGSSREDSAPGAPSRAGVRNSQTLLTHAQRRQALRAGRGPSTHPHRGLGLLLMLAGMVVGLCAFDLAATRRENAQGSAPASVPVTSEGDEPRRALGRSPRKGARVPSEVPTTRFSDVAGCDEAIEELRELVAFLREPERFTRTGATPPKGALLAGPPGTGKTLLARAVAGEAGVAFFAVAGSDFVEKYVGVGAQRVRELFQSARAHEPAIIFIDEVDALARRRSGDGEGGAVEGENTLVALLSEMDGFTGSNVVVLAATNRPDILDAAVLRPGRLDRRVEVPNPDRRGREQILAVHTEGKPLVREGEGAVNLLGIARRTPGFSGAQLAQVVNEACLQAVRREADVVDQSCFDHAVAHVAMGRARTSALVTDHDREVTAWHEAGHTVAALLLREADDPVQVSIIPRGAAGGVTWMSGNDDLFLTRRKAHAQLVVALGGRAGEEVLLEGEFTQGASSDLAAATDLARMMVTQYGMSRLGYQVRNPNTTDGEVGEVVEELLVQAHASARALMSEHRELLQRIAVTLLDEETLTLAQLRELAGGRELPPVHSVPTPALPQRRAPLAETANSPIPLQRRQEPARRNWVRALSARIRERRTNTRPTALG